MKTTIYQINSDFNDFVELYTNLSDEKIIFLTDSEAKISIIKSEAIPADANIDIHDIITIMGITAGKTNTLGSVLIDIKFSNVIFEHKFHIVNNSVDIPTHGILGKDFLKPNGFSMNYGEMILSTNIDGIKIYTDIKTEINENYATIPPNSEIFKMFHIPSNQFPCIIPAQKLSENIHTATAIAYTKDTWIRVANVTNKTSTITTNNIKTEPLNNYRNFQTSSDIQTETNEERRQRLKEILSNRIPEHIRRKLLRLITDYSDIFHLPGDKATNNNFYSQELNIRDNEPVYVKNYRLPQSQKNEIRSQVKELLANDLIELSNSNCNSPLILVPKKNAHT